MTKEEMEKIFEACKELKQVIDELDRIQDLIAMAQGMNSQLYISITDNNTKAKKHLGKAYQEIQNLIGQGRVTEC